MGTEEYPSLIDEQRYYNRAHEAREEFRSRPFTSAGADRKAERALRRAHDAAREGLQPPEQIVCFGWSDNNEQRFYVGYDNVHEDGESLILSWKARAALPYTQAAPHEPLGLAAKREFIFNGHNIKSFSDTIFADLQRRVADLGKVSDSLLDDLQRSRTGEMQDIVRTIQASQAKIMSADHQQLLIIQGGPGTGKTAVALHRVSWLLYNEDALKPSDILIIGPSSLFIRYIGAVLPALGDRTGDGAIRQVAITELGQKVTARATEAVGTARLKGEARMMGLLSRALRDRVRASANYELKTSGNVTVRLNSATLATAIEQAFRGRYKLGRVRLRNAIQQDLTSQFKDWNRRVDVDQSSIDRLVEQIWPTLSAAQFLQDLFGSTDRLIRAAGSEFTAAEVQMLYRQASERLSTQDWSAADLPLLDYAEERINGIASEYRHIVVDEVQDLSPMQLRMIGARSPNGFITALGDLAQSTGDWARDEWQDVIEGLSVESEWISEVPTAVAELTHGYRVPRQLFDFAALLLPIASPGTSKPEVVRDGETEPEIIASTVDDISMNVLDVSKRYAGRGLQTGVIVPDDLRDSVTAAFDRDGVQWASAEEGLSSTIVVLAPVDAKGLEFDATVVVEPATIAKTSGRGERLLYVCLTRSTKHLAVVHSRPYPLLGLRGHEGESDTKDLIADQTIDTHQRIAGQVSPSRSRIVEQIAKLIASDLRDSINRERWDEILERVRELLSEGESQ